MQTIDLETSFKSCAYSDKGFGVDDVCSFRVSSIVITHSYVIFYLSDWLQTERHCIYKWYSSQLGSCCPYMLLEVKAKISRFVTYVNEVYKMELAIPDHTFFVKAKISRFVTYVNEVYKMKLAIPDHTFFVIVLHSICVMLYCPLDYTRALCCTLVPLVLYFTNSMTVF